MGRVCSRLSWTDTEGTAARLWTTVRTPGKFPEKTAWHRGSLYELPRILVSPPPIRSILFKRASQADLISCRTNYLWICISIWIPDSGYADRDAAEPKRHVLLSTFWSFGPNGLSDTGASMWSLKSQIISAFSIFPYFHVSAVPWTRSKTECKTDWLFSKESLAKKS